MKRFTLFFILLAEVLLAQSREVEKILQKKDVIWAAEIELEYAIEPELWSTPDSLLLDKCKTVGTHLKQVAQSDTYERTSIRFSEFIADEKFERDSGNLLPVQNCIHQDARFKKPIKVSSWGGDTVVCIDPETHREYWHFIPAYTLDFYKNSQRSLILRQLVYYTKRDHAFHFKTLSYAPLSTAFVTLISASDKTIPRQQFFGGWRKPAKLKRCKKVQDPDISWAYRVETNILHPIDFQRLEPSKGTWEAVQSELYHRLLARKAKGVEDMQARQISETQLNWLVARSDTMLQIDHTTGGEALDIYQYKLKPKMLNKWKIIQDLLWDSNQNRLIIRPRCVVSVMDRYDVQSLSVQEQSPEQGHLNFAAFYLPIASK